MEQLFKRMLKNKDMVGQPREFVKVILGEFNRVDDGKPCTDEQVKAVLQKMVKNSKKILSLIPGDMIATLELNFLQQFLPQEACGADLKAALQTIITTTGQVKNRMQYMKPSIDFLEEKGFDVDKKKLRQILLDLDL